MKEKKAKNWKCVGAQDKLGKPVTLCTFKGAHKFVRLHDDRRVQVISKECKKPEFGDQWEC